MDFQTTIDHHSLFQEAVSLLIAAGLLGAPLGWILALWGLIWRRGLPRLLLGPAAIFLIASGLSAVAMLLQTLFEISYSGVGLLGPLLVDLLGLAAWGYVLSPLRSDEIIDLRLGP